MTRRFPKKWQVGLYALAAVILVSVSGNLVADGLGTALPALSDTGLIWAGIGLVALAMGYLLAWRAVKLVQRQPYDFNKVVEEPPARPVVVLGLSSISWEVEVNATKGAEDPDRIVLRRGSHAYPLGWVRGLRGFLEGCKQTKLDDADGTIADGFPWCVPLTAIAHHLCELKAVGIVTSTDPPSAGAARRQGSHQQRADFTALLGLLLEDDGFTVEDRVVSPGEKGTGVSSGAGASTGGRSQVVIATFSTPVDFDKVTPVYQRVDDLIRLFGDEAQRGDDVVVDATGGTTPVGIATALASLNSDVLLQYVDKDREVVGFNYNIRQSPVLPT